MDMIRRMGFEDYFLMDKLMAHHKGKDSRCNGQHHRFGKTAQHIENAAVPRLRVEPTSEAISPTLAFTLSNRPERLPVMPSIKMPFIHFSMISLIKQRYLLSRALPCERESAE